MRLLEMMKWLNFIHISLIAFDRSWIQVSGLWEIRVTVEGYIHFAKVCDILCLLVVAKITESLGWSVSVFAFTPHSPTKPRPTMFGHAAPSGTKSEGGGNRAFYAFIISFITQKVMETCNHSFPIIEFCIIFIMQTSMHNLDPLYRA